MSAQNLYSILKSRIDDEWALNVGGETFLAEQMIQRADSLRALHDDLHGQDVALNFENRAHLALALLAFDGFVRRLMLLPFEVSAAVRQQLVESVGIANVIEDADLAALRPAKSIFRADMETRWLLPTSGTTGVPKIVEHDWSSLGRTVKKVRKDLGRRWGLLYDLNRFAGIQLFLQALLGGDSLTIPSFSADIGNTLQQFLKFKVNALSATPTWWRKILMAPQSKKLLLEQITLGGEIADQKTLDLLKAQWPQARVVHIYASTEAGVGFSVHDGREGFPALWLNGGLAEADLTIKDDVLWIRGQNSEDRVEIRGDRVHFLGRESGAINVGGNKVMPEEIERVLLDHPLVAAVRVWAKKNPFTGSVVMAEVVLRQAGASNLECQAELLRHCRANMPPYKVPALVEIVADLGMNAMGKLKREA